MRWLPSLDAPFGPLEPLHQYILANAAALDYYNWPFLFTIPLVPLAAVTYLVQFPDTRQYRIPMSILGISLMAHAAVSYRFTNPIYMAFNNVIGISAMHLTIKYLEFGFVAGPVIDPYVQKGTRSHWRAAIDMPINSRMVGLGQFHLDAPPRGQPANDTTGADGGIILHEDGVPHKKERWLPYTNTHRTRLQATARHALHAGVHYVMIDTLCELLWHFGAGSIARPLPKANAYADFVRGSKFVFFPDTPYAVLVPKAGVASVMNLCIGTGVWQGISWGYHSLACVLVGTGFYEVEAWEVDLFDAPWKADSLLDMWGRRWHQIFRHHFLLIATVILDTLRLPLRPNFLLPLVFTTSGLMHALGQMSMSPVPDPAHMCLFFILSGLGSALEVGFKRLTGRKVRGWWGRAWMWAWFMWSGSMVVRAWMDGGIGGTRLVPVEWDHRPGPVVVGWLTRWCFDVRP